MRIGYSFWGFLGDYKEDDKGNALSTPDGNAAYGGFLIDAMIRAGHDVFFMQTDRDWHTFQRRGKYDFESFSQDRRFKAYLGPIRIGELLPNLDMLFLEWRFPIPGRNTLDMKGKPGYQPDLERQMQLIEYYRGRGTKIVIWDLDYKLSPVDEAAISPDAVIETAVKPNIVVGHDYKGTHLRVEPPVAIEDLLQHEQLPVDPNRKLVYVGSRYERDDVIEEWIKPVSDRFPGQVEFWGNWTAEYNFAEVQAKWPNVKYCDRITMKDFRKAYGTAVAVPLLAKRSYLSSGFITPRIWEAIIFGTLPVGLSSHRGIEQYLPSSLIARDSTDLGDIVDHLARAPIDERKKIRELVADKIKFMDAGNFVKVLESIK